jgi:hypothetical protein
MEGDTVDKQLSETSKPVWSELIHAVYWFFALSLFCSSNLWLLSLQARKDFLWCYSFFFDSKSYFTSWFQKFQPQASKIKMKFHKEADPNLLYKKSEPQFSFVMVSSQEKSIFECKWYAYCIEVTVVEGSVQVWIFQTVYLCTNKDHTEIAFRTFSFLVRFLSSHDLVRMQKSTTYLLVKHNKSPK